MKLGIVDVGGGLRGIYATGVLDYCLDQGICFDCCIGVSAGSANLASYLAGQRGRNRRFYLEYARRKEYMGLWNFLRTGSYINMEYVYHTLSNSDGEDPLDYAALEDSSATFLVTVANALTGEGRYFTKEDIRQDDYRILEASSSIPGINRPCLIEGVPYFDGALADPVPIEKAFSLACDKVVLLLTRPASQPREPGKDPFLARCIQRKYPVSAQNLRARAERYNQAVEAAKQYAREGKVLIIAPDRLDGVSTLSRAPGPLTAFYDMGYQDAQALSRWLV